MEGDHSRRIKATRFSPNREFPSTFYKVHEDNIVIYRGDDQTTYAYGAYENGKVRKLLGEDCGRVKNIYPSLVTDIPEEITKYIEEIFDKHNLL